MGQYTQAVTQPSGRSVTRPHAGVHGQPSVHVTIRQRDAQCAHEPEHEHRLTLAGSRVDNTGLSKDAIPGERSHQTRFTNLSLKLPGVMSTRTFASEGDQRLNHLTLPAIRTRLRQAAGRRWPGCYLTVYWTVHLDGVAAAVHFDGMSS